MTLILSGTDGLSDVDGSAATPAIRGTDANTGIFFPAADTIAFSEGGAEIARFDSSGNLGIGTSSPSYKLDVSGTGNYDGVLRVRSTGTNTPAVYLGVDAVASADGYVGTVNNFPFQLRTNDLIRATIDTSGNFLVGATATIASHKVVIEKANDGQLLLNATTAGSSVFTTISFANQGTVKTQIFWQSTSSQFHVQNGTGGVYVALNGTTWTSASDERSKTDLVPIENAAQKVSTLRSVTGRYKTDAEGTSRSFLIAQDVQAVLPEAVDASDPESLGVQYTDVIPLLVAAIKEQQAIITQLQADVAALQAPQGTP